MLAQQTIDWIVREVSADAHVQSIHQLKGSTSSSLYALTLQTSDGVKKVVLRLFDQHEWVKEEPDVAIHEATSLRVVQESHVETPRILAFDRTGNDCGVPAVLMSFLKGSVELHPHHMDHWLEQLGEALVHIHMLPVDDFNWSYVPYNDIHQMGIPSWTQDRPIWQQAMLIVRQQPPTYSPCFIHRDYHPTNVLWENAEVHGVVDWVNACTGPAGIDVGHCRVNLAILYGVSEADRFLAAYERHANHPFVYDVYWDFISVFDFLSDPLTVYPGWEVFGKNDLTTEKIQKRLDTYMKTLIDRI